MSDPVFAHGQHVLVDRLGERVPGTIRGFPWDSSWRPDHNQWHYNVKLRNGFVGSYNERHITPVDAITSLGMIVEAPELELPIHERLPGVRLASAIAAESGYDRVMSEQVKKKKKKPAKKKKKLPPGGHRLSMTYNGWQLLRLTVAHMMVSTSDLDEVTRLKVLLERFPPLNHVEQAARFKHEPKVMRRHFHGVEILTLKRALEEASKTLGGTYTNTVVLLANKAEEIDIEAVSLLGGLADS